MFSIELFVFNDGEITFENKWARLAPNNNEREFAFLAASKNMVVQSESESYVLVCRLPDLRFMFRD